MRGAQASSTALAACAIAVLLLGGGCGSRPSAGDVRWAVERSLFGCENHPCFGLENFVFENGTQEAGNRYTAVVSYDIVLKKSGKEIWEGFRKGEGDGFSPDLLAALAMKWFGQVLLEGSMEPEALPKGLRVHQREKVQMVRMDKGWAIASELDSLYSR